MDIKFPSGGSVSLSEATGVLPVANGGTGVTGSTGTGATVLSTSPTLVTPNIGVATGTSLAAALNGSLGATTPSTVAATTISATDVSASGNLGANGVTITRKTSFTPTTVGWYRIMSAGGDVGGTVEIQAAYDGNATKTRFDFQIKGYGQGSDIMVTQVAGVNSNMISSIRTSSDGGANLYLDVYVNTATFPSTISVFGYGPSMQNFVASPVVGAVVGSTSVKTVNSGYHGILGYSGLRYNTDFDLTGNFIVTGDITATGNITAYYSDDRLKTKLGNIENALDKVSKLNGFYYEANETAQALGYKPVREVGVSAQSVEAILPELIKPAPIDPQYKTLDYARLVPLLIEAIKEQQGQINELKSRLGK